MPLILERPSPSSASRVAVRARDAGRSTPVRADGRVVDTPYYTMSYDLVLAAAGESKGGEA